jgi:hypothetical protein
MMPRTVPPVGRTATAAAGCYRAVCDRCGWRQRLAVRLRSHALDALTVHTREVHRER